MGARRLFIVGSGRTLALSNLRLENGAVSNGSGGLVNVYPTGIASITGCTLANGHASISSCYSQTLGNGGALYSVGTAIVAGSTFTGNQASASVSGGSGSDFCTAGNGGAVYASGKLLVANSTFSGNGASDVWGYSSVGGNGGAIFLNGCRATIWSSSFAGNVASASGSSFGTYGLGAALYGAATVKNTLFVAGATGANCAAGPVNDGNNLDSDGSCGLGPAQDALLDPTGLSTASGGLTATIGLQTGSPAINAGDQQVCAAAPVLGVDQRGKLRPGTGAASCSIGAFEYAGR
jgi:hypothetical protein